MSGIEDYLERRIILLSWFFEQYLRHLPTESILRYEDVIESGGKTLKVITRLAEDLNETLQSRNSNQMYEPAHLTVAGEALLKSEGAYWEFYSKENVQMLLDKVD